MKKTALLLTLLLALGSCGNRRNDTVATPEGEKPIDEVIHTESGGPKIKAMKVPPTTVGDVEANVLLSARLADQSRSDNIRVKELQSRNETLHLVTIDISEPVPQELWLDCTTFCKTAFKKRPVAVVGKIMAEDRVIGEFSAAFGKKSHEEKVKVTVDAFKGLDTIPETMLVIAKAKASLLPEGTVFEEIDPLTAEAKPDDTTYLQSNPVRINIHMAPSSASDEPATR
jgi:hypothetical protein